jgi:Sec-independent protein translocase protein TatA
MSLISPVHILFIAAFALIFIGPKRLPEAARGLAAALRGFRDVLNGDIRRRELSGSRDGALAAADGASPPAPAGPAG